MCKFDRNPLTCDYSCSNCELDEISKSITLLSNFSVDKVSVEFYKSSAKYFVIRSIGKFDYWNFFTDDVTARNYYNKLKLAYNQPIDKL